MGVGRGRRGGGMDEGDREGESGRAEREECECE